MNIPLRKSSFQILQFSRLRRHLHTPRKLHFDIEQGLGDFLTPQGCKLVAVDFQNGLLGRINELIPGTPFENMDLAQTVVQTSSSREHVLLFKYASLALNNSFFIANLRPPLETPSKPGLDLAHQIASEFGSQSHFQSSMSAAADGMSASGWIWLVSDQTGHLGIVPTYGSGTLLIRTRQQRIPPLRGELHDMFSTAFSGTQVSHTQSTSHTPTKPNTVRLGAVYMPPAPLPSQGQVRSISLLNPESPARSNQYLGSITFPHDDKRGVILNPLLCISLQEHAWLGSGYGVWGKKEYLRRFWNVVDWEQVSKNYEYWKQPQLAT